MAFHSINQLRYPSEPITRVIYGYACACGAQESFLVSQTPRVVVTLELLDRGHLGLIEYTYQGRAYSAPTVELIDIARCFECNENSLKLISVANMC